MIAQRVRVRLGLNYLDSLARQGDIPENWFDKIDLDTLNMRDARHCILGQLFGSYWDVVDSLKNAVTLSDSEACSLGFNAYGHDRESFMDEILGLQAVWETAIEFLQADGNCDAYL